MSIIKQYASDDCIRISWYNEKTDLLGPFFRFALWVQGCERKCPGCIAEHIQSPGGGKDIKISELAEIIAASTECEGITISGGEPFYQADRICALAESVKALRPDFGVIIYTGYTLEELKSSDENDVLRLLGMTDILIDGPYIETLDDNAGLRGSSNQQIHFLTGRYLDFREMYEIPSGRRNSIVINDSILQMTGIPSESTKQLLKKIMK